MNFVNVSHDNLTLLVKTNGLFFFLNLLLSLLVERLKTKQPPRQDETRRALSNLCLDNENEAAY